MNPMTTRPQISIITGQISNAIEGPGNACQRAAGALASGSWAALGSRALAWLKSIIPETLAGRTGLHSRPWRLRIKLLPCDGILACCRELDYTDVRCLATRLAAE